MTAFQHVKAVLIDLSGTLHIGNTAVANCQAALERLRTAGCIVRFVTNTTKEPKRVLLERLQNLQFNIRSEEIFTSLTAAADLIHERKLRPYLVLEDSAKEDFKDVQETDPNAVVVGLSPKTLNYNVLNEAFRLLNEGAVLIAIHKARYYKTNSGFSLGPGPFVAALEHASGVQAEIVGKPDAKFFLSALKGLEVEPHEVVMIGDDAKDDIEGALTAGLMGILVQTGKYRPGDEETLAILPSAVVPSFTEAVDLILQR